MSCGAKVFSSTAALLEDVFLAFEIIEDVGFVRALAEHGGDVFDGEFHLAQAHESLHEYKFWPPVARVDNVFGDRNPGLLPRRENGTDPGEAGDKN